LIYYTGPSLIITGKNRFGKDFCHQIPIFFLQVGASHPSARLMLRVKMGCEHCQALLMTGPASLIPKMENLRFAR
jgi:hypothetical protein